MDLFAGIVRRSLCTTTLLLTIWAGVSRGQVNSFVEDFTTTAYKDASGTTADWNTLDGELSLFPFVPTLTGVYNTSGSAENVHVSGDRAYVADGTAGLRVIDISDPAAPVLVGTYDTPGFANTVRVAGDHAFVGDGTLGLQVIDISNPAAPTLAGTYNTSGYVRGIHVAGDHAYLADGTPGLRVIDISDPTAPTLAATYNTSGYARDVTVAGDHAYVADGIAGLQVIDISDPAAPTLAGTYDTSGDSYGVWISGDHVYLADNTAGLKVIDVSDPAAPVLAGTFATPGVALGVHVSGDHAYVADDAFGLQVIDISNPAAPVLADTYNTAGNAKGVRVWGNQAYVADSASGLQVVGIAVPVVPVLTGNYQTSGTARRVHVSGDHAFVATGGPGLGVIDISDPAAPIQVGAYNTFGTCWDVYVSGDHAYVADGTAGLLVLDISDPATPSFVGLYGTLGDSRGVHVSGDHAYVADGDGLFVIDISDPASPVLAGTYVTPGWGQSVCVSGNRAYVVDEGGLRVVDVSDPTAPSLTGSYNASSLVQGGYVSGDHAYLADALWGLVIVDVSDPTSPFPVAVYDPVGGPRDVHVVGDHAYLAGISSLEVVDISDPVSPTLAATYDTPGQTYGVYVSGDHAYVGDGDAGLAVVQVYQREMDTTRNQGHSLAIDATNDAVVRTRVSTTQIGAVSWELTANNGSNWQVVPANSSWAQIASPGPDLLWRSTHDWTPGVNPTAIQLTVEWLNDFARIESIADIPGDQGKQVRVEWLRSGHDFVGDATQIVEYAVYREIDPDLPMASMRAETRSFDDLSPAARGNALMMQAAGWDFITTVPVLVEDHYAVVVPTLADSTIVSGGYQTTFRVTALTATPGVFFHSPPDSGYSVDNLAPAAPAAFTIAYNTGSGNTLFWDESPDADFQYFRVYRSTNPDFVPTPADLVHSTTSTGWVDPEYDGGAVHYRVTATDFSGNESDAAAAGTVTSAPVGVLPTRWALHGNAPNPFHPQTRIRYSVPAGGGDVSLRIYDVGGRLVRILVNGPGSPGDRSVTWDARDDRGQAVASGVYLYRLTTDGVALTRKMVLAK